MQSTGTASKNIIETAAAEGSFSTLGKALKAADLVGTLEGKGPFTVFAPNDQAFTKLPTGRLAEWMKPENKAKLTSTLKFHVIPGVHKAAELAKLKTLKTAEGTDLAIHAENGKVGVGGGHVTKADIECSNGVIHVVDTVSMPK